MEKMNFACDYLEGAHPLILERLLKANLEKNPGYSQDKYCDSAKEKIRKACNCPDAEIHFLSGGTQANAMVIKYLLSAYQGVIAPATGHISLHESGADAGEHHALYIGKLQAVAGEIIAESAVKTGHLILCPHPQHGHHTAVRPQTHNFGGGATDINAKNNFHNPILRRDVFLHHR